MAAQGNGGGWGKGTGGWQVIQQGGKRPGPPGAGRDPKEGEKYARTEPQEEAAGVPGAPFRGQDEWSRGYGLQTERNPQKFAREGIHAVTAMGLGVAYELQASTVRGMIG